MLHTPSPLGWGSQDQSLSCPIPQSSTSDCGIYTLPLATTLCGGWYQGWVEQGRAAGARKEGKGEKWGGVEGGRASSPELRPAWRQCQGDPADLGAVLRALAQG